MSRPSGSRIETARRLLAREALADGSPGAAARVCEKLRQQVGPLIGAAGFQALFARSFQLAKLEHPGLGELVNGERAEGQAGVLRAHLARQTEEVAGDSAAALFATFLDLLGSFIGDALTDRMLLGGWPATTAPETSERNK